ncbi:ABC transporter permease subunit [Gryllotalpicola sp.]|uniref:ABC transporter permease n=1 Tax=Gryllotalpicola sp. TaxID=1932787 RepID=UPI002603190A|nr:ABC transporter permease subunit [Gryllotalpicola sp.]
MISFLARRFIASIVVLLVASYLVYVLTCYSGDPLQDLEQTKLPNKQFLIDQRIAFLHLDVPPALRYFIWFGGILQGFVGNFSLGLTNGGQQVTAQLGTAVVSTLQLLSAATVIAIVVGLTIGIATALRQYTAFDYATTFVSFLFYSLPSFWLAVMLKQYLAIGFNNFLQDPVISPIVIAAIAVAMGIVWLGILGGSLRRRLTIFLISGAATAAVLLYLSATRWFDDPSLGIGVVGVLAIGLAVLVTALTAGLENRRALYSALTTAAIGIALYYPLQYVFPYASFGLIALLAFAAIGVGLLVGWLWGGFDRDVSMRGAAITAVLVGIVIAIDRFMRVWRIYTTSSYINNRPIATIGSGTPNLQGDFWVTGLDTFTHLALPTLAFTLASLAAYSRYTRASMLDVMNQDYIRTARSKGLNERTVVMRHAFRNALIPIVTIITLDFGALIGGAIVTEKVFGIQGMGALFQNALTVVDVNTVMGVFLVTGISAIVFNVIADVVYSSLDPRIRVSS